MNRTLVGFMVIVTTLHAGCTTELQSRQDGYGPYTKTPEGSRVEIGSRYTIPMLQFKLSVRRTLLQCTDEDNIADIRFLTKVEAEPTYIAGERFSIDNEKLTSWSKVSRFSLDTYDSGVIKSVNASAEDQTKAIVGNVVKSGISLLSLVAEVPLGSLSQEPYEDGHPIAPPTFVCNAGSISALREIESETKILETQTEKLVILTDEVARLERLASLGALSDETKNQLNQAQKDTAAQYKLVKKSDQSLAKWIKRVSVSEEIIWPRSPMDTELNAAPNPQSKATLLALFTKGANGYSEEQLLSTLHLKGRLAPVVNMNDPVKCTKKQSLCSQNLVEADEGEGLLYRDPVAARLLICEVADVRNCDVNGASGVVVSSIVTVPQMGRLRLLPFRNGAFQNNELKVSFRENGSIASINYDEKVARGQELAQSISAGLDQAVVYRDAKQAYEIKKDFDAKLKAEAERKSILDELDAKIAVLQKTKQINELNAETSQNASFTDVKAETARLNAQIALLEAQRKAREAEQALD